MRLSASELVRVGPELEVSRELMLREPPRKQLVLSGRAVESQAQEHR